MSNPLEGVRIFVHQPLRNSYDDDLLHATLGLILVEDSLDNGDNSIEARFLRSQAPIAYIYASPLVLEDTSSLIGSDILRDRAVCLVSLAADPKVLKLNRKLISRNFQTITIAETESPLYMAGLFLEALARATATS